MPLDLRCRTSNGGSCVGVVTLDGGPADVEDLKDGQVVEAHGTRASPEVVGSAFNRAFGRVTVDIKRAIVGQVEAIDSVQATLRVLGQQVYVDGWTTLDYSSLEDISVGDAVAVSGHFAPDGRVLATRVEAYTGAPLFLLRGILSARPNGHLAIGDTEVDLAAATREGFPGSAPLAGDAVLVLASGPPVNGLLTSDRVRCTGQCAATRWETGFARGFLTAWRSTTDFDVDGLAVRPALGGLAPPVGSLVDVSLTNGVATVTPALGDIDTIRVSGSIEALAPASGEITVLGMRVQLTPGTYRDPSLVDLADLAVDRLVTVRGGLVGDTIVAGEIALGVSGAAIRSAVFSRNPPAIRVAGQAILTDELTQVTYCKGASGIDELFGWAGDDADSLSIQLRAQAAPLVASTIDIDTTCGNQRGLNVSPDGRVL